MATTTWNPSDKSASVTLSGGNLVASTPGGGFFAVRGSTSKSSGKWVFEINIDTGTQHMVGFANSAQVLTTYPGATGNNSIGYYSSAGERFLNGSSAAYGTGFALGDDVMCCVDADARTCFFIRNGTSYASIDISAISGALFPCWSSNTSAAVTTNFGATAFVNTLPSGYDAWNNDAGGGGIVVPVFMNQYRQRRA